MESKLSITNRIAALAQVTQSAAGPGGQRSEHRERAPPPVTSDIEARPTSDGAPYVGLTCGIYGTASSATSTFPPGAEELDGGLTSGRTVEISKIPKSVPTKMFRSSRT